MLKTTPKRMNKILLFVILSIPVIAVSWRTLFNPGSHGFYRFFSWECILWLFVNNYTYWFVNPWSVYQLLSWFLLIAGSYVVLAGVLKLKKAGKATSGREDKNLYSFERTTELVDTGIYKYIRHPLYGSLIYVTWAIYFKHPAWPLFVVACLSTLLLYLTAKFDEKECTLYFGEKYHEYMNHSKMFIPYIF
jgi:protein-S-isoprenylcysteine O-methyltransferase Ste14